MASYENVDVTPPLRSLIEDNMLQMNEINLLYIKKAPSWLKLSMRITILLNAKPEYLNVKS